MKFQSVFVAASLCLPMIVSAADGGLQRLTSIGLDKVEQCASLEKRALVGYESQPARVTYGSCTCAPNNVQGRAGGFECVLYFTIKN